MLLAYLAVIVAASMSLEADFQQIHYPKEVIVTPKLVSNAGNIKSSLKSVEKVKVL